MRSLKALANTVLFLLLVFFASAFDLPGTEELRHFDAQQIAEYQRDSAFDYSTEYAVSDSIITLFLAWLLDKLSYVFRSMGMQDVWPFVFRVLIVGVVLMVLYYILKNRYGTVLERNSKSYVPMGVTSVDGQRVDYDALIKESKAHGDYKLAIRYQFLKCLHDLHKSDQIKITTWKAPLDYVDELPAGKQEAFSSLVTLFEVTWYGDYDAQEEQFEESNVLLETIYG